MYRQISTRTSQAKAEQQGSLRRQSDYRRDRDPDGGDSPQGQLRASRRSSGEGGRLEPDPAGSALLLGIGKGGRGQEAISLLRGRPVIDSLESVAHERGPPAVGQAVGNAK